MDSAKTAISDRPLFPELAAWMDRTGSNQGHLARYLDITESQASEYMQKGWPVEHCLRLALLTDIRPERFTKDRRLARMLKFFGKRPTSAEATAND